MPRELPSRRLRHTCIAADHHELNCVRRACAAIARRRGRVLRAGDARACRAPLPGDRLLVNYVAGGEHVLRNRFMRCPRDRAVDADDFALPFPRFSMPSRSSVGIVEVGQLPDRANERFFGRRMGRHRREHPGRGQQSGRAAPPPRPQASRPAGACVLRNARPRATRPAGTR